MSGTSKRGFPASIVGYSFFLAALYAGSRKKAAASEGKLKSNVDKNERTSKVARSTLERYAIRIETKCSVENIRLISDVQRL